LQRRSPSSAITRAISVERALTIRATVGGAS
jgi:hypothetical protein